MKVYVLSVHFLSLVACIAADLLKSICSHAGLVPLTIAVHHHHLCTRESCKANVMFSGKRPAS